MSVSVDLIKTIRYPIDRFDKRLSNTFITGTIIVVLYEILTFSALKIVLPKLGITLDANDSVTFVIRPLIMLMYLIELCFSFNSLFVSCYGIRMRKGLNFQKRKTVFRKYLSIVTVRLTTIVPVTIFTI